MFIIFFSISIGILCAIFFEINVFAGLLHIFQFLFRKIRKKFTITKEREENSKIMYVF